MLYVPEPHADEIIGLAPFVAPYHSVDGKATAYVCRGHVCSLPTTDVGQMITFLSPSEEENGEA